MNKILAVSIIVFVAIIATIIPNASAHGVVDQSFTGPFNAAVNTDSSAFFVQDGLGQEFTPTATNLAGVDLFLDANPPYPVTSDVTVQIRSNGIDGDILGQQQQSVNIFGPTTIHFDFTTPVPLTLGNVYVIRVSSTGNPDQPILWSQDFSSNAYLGGNAILGGVLQPAADFGFNTYSEIIDTTPPVITVPAPITQITTSPAGAAVTFPVTATDPDSLAISITCNPPSASIFPIGITTVTCSATDEHGNTSTASFTVTIQTPAQATQNLINLINGPSFPHGLQSSLASTLNNIDLSSPSACGKLNAFINKVNNDLNQGLLTPAQAAQLLQSANAIKSAIGCP